MRLKLIRTWFTDKTTIGKLYIDNAFECYTLEDKEREYPDKIKGETAIWAGTYKLAMDYSPKYKKIMPHVLDVPLFEGIRIHSGNKAEHTEGCILVGNIKGNDAVYQSKVAFDKLYKILSDVKEDITIEIISEKGEKQMREGETKTLWNQLQNQMAMARSM